MESPDEINPKIFAIDTVAYDQMQVARHRRHRQVVLFSVTIFLAVFGVMSYVSYYKSAQEALKRVIGSSYALQTVSIRSEPSKRAPVTGRVQQAEIVEITGAHRDQEGLDWFSILRNDSLGYVLVSEVAPAKGSDAESSYRLLKASLANLTEPGELANGRRALELYKKLYPSDERRDELLWIMAEKSRDLGQRSRSRELMVQARKAYEELAAGSGEYAARSKEVLVNLPVPAQKGGGSRIREDQAEVEIVGASASPGYRVYDSKQKMPHKFMLLNQTEVHVNLGGQQAKPGQVLQGIIANDVVTNGETAVPAGSICKVVVNSGVQNGMIELQLQSMLIGGRSYSVDATPVRVRAAGMGETAALRADTPLLFRLRRTLILSQ
jgi:hypothetical protein